MQVHEQLVRKLVEKALDLQKIADDDFELVDTKRCRFTCPASDVHDDGAARGTLVYATGKYVCPECGEKDIAWLAELWGMELWQDGQDSSLPLFARTGHWAHEYTYAQPEWMIEGIYPKGCSSMVSGREGSGKGNHSLMAAKSMIEGVEFLGRQARKAGAVVYVDLDDPRCVIGDRMSRLKLLGHKNLRVWDMLDTPPPPPNFGDPVYRELADKLGGSVFFFFNSLIDFSEGANENDPAAMAMVMAKFKSLAMSCAGAEVQHHSSKYGENGGRGTTAIQAKVDMAWDLKKEPGDDGDDLLTLSTTKPKMTPFQAIKYVSSFRGGGLTFTLASAAKMRSTLEAGLEIVQANPGINSSDLKAELRDKGYSKKQTEDVIKPLQGKCKVEGGGNNRTYWPKCEKKGNE